MITMPIAGTLADRVPIGRTVPFAMALIALGFFTFTQVGVDTSYVLLCGSLFVMGLGMGGTMMPIMTSALRTLDSQDVARGSTLVNILQQIGGSIGTATMSVILTSQLNGSAAVPGVTNPKTGAPVTEAGLAIAHQQGAPTPPQLLPVIERGLQFVADSFANRIGRGTHRALDRCQELARTFPFVLQLDVRQFFPSVDHAILRARIARKITEPGVLRLVDAILASGKDVLSESYDMVSFPGDDLFAVLRPRGLPIGNLTSQFWGNVYLDPIDHFVKRDLRCREYVRYVDDLLLFGDDKGALWTARDRLVERLAGLRLTIHRGAHPRPVGEGIPFLGFVVFPERRRLKCRKVVEFRRSLVALLASLAAGEIGPGRAAQSVRSWLEHARHGNTWSLRQSILAELPQTLRDLLN